MADFPIHHPHPHLAERDASGPFKTLYAYGKSRNARIALAITNAVGTMLCAYIFTALALISLPASIKSGSLIILVSWVAQTFLQLVLLAVIMVGQNVAAKASDARAIDTFNDAEAILHGQKQMHAHLRELQDQVLGLHGHMADVEALVAKKPVSPSMPPKL